MAKASPLPLLLGAGALLLLSGGKKKKKDGPKDGCPEGWFIGENGDCARPVDDPNDPGNIPEDPPKEDPNAPGTKVPDTPKNGAKGGGKKKGKQGSGVGPSAYVPEPPPQADEIWIAPDCLAVIEGVDWYEKDLKPWIQDKLEGYASGVEPDLGEGEVYIGGSVMIHPLAVLGNYFGVVAMDGTPVAGPFADDSWQSCLSQYPGWHIRSDYNQFATNADASRYKADMDAYARTFPQLAKVLMDIEARIVQDPDLKNISWWDVTTIPTVKGAGNEEVKAKVIIMDNHITPHIVDIFETDKLNKAIAAGQGVTIQTSYGADLSYPELFDGIRELHNHTITLTAAQIGELWQRRGVQAETDTVLGHNHRVFIEL